MDSNLLRKKLSTLIKTNKLKYTEIARKAGIPRTSIANFMNGTVKEPKLEVVLAIANFLKFDLQEIFPAFNEGKEERRLERKKDLQPTLEKKLFLDCVKYFMDIIDQKGITLTIDESLTIIKRVYEYSQQYTDSTIEPSFLDWCIEDIKRTPQVSTHPFLKPHS